eukprot:scaffold1734_cov64-Cyclotella_meneghiniana.AAC.6
MKHHGYTILLLAYSSTAFSPLYPSHESVGKQCNSAASSPSYQCNNNNHHRIIFFSSTVDVETREQSNENESRQRPSPLLFLHDVVPISFFATCCLLGAFVISSYEDFDVTHVRPNPSTLRLCQTTSRSKYCIGAATRGMGWGLSDRIQLENKNQQDIANNNADAFENWYGSSATTLQWKPSYNEIMLEHRSDRVPRWNIHKDRMLSTELSSTVASAPPNMEELQWAVLNLYQSLDELDNLKVMADNYQWDEIKAAINPSNKQSSIRSTLEYSMDILKASSSIQSQERKEGEDNNIATVIGFDWGSCAWRHCGAKADGQEALAELYSSVGMLEPFEVRFVIGEICMFVI